MSHSQSTYCSCWGFKIWQEFQILSRDEMLFVMVCRIVNSVEAISASLLKEDNFTDYKHFADELAFKAEMVRIRPLTTAVL